MNSDMRSGKETFSNISEQTRIFQQGIKKDIVPLIKKLIPIRSGTFISHSATELKEKGVSSEPSAFKRSVGATEKTVLPPYIETARKVGTQIGRFLKLLLAFTPSKQTLEEKSVHITRTTKQLPHALRDRAKTLFRPEKKATQPQPENKPQVEAQSVEKKAALLLLEKEVSKLSDSLKKLDQFEQQGKALPKHLQEKFFRDVALGREKLTKELNRIIVQAGKSEPSRAVSLPEDRIPIYKSLIKINQQIIEMLSKLPPSEELMAKIQFRKKEGLITLGKYLAMDEKTVNSRAKNVLDKKTYENMKVIIEFYRNKSYVNSKLVFNKETKMFSILEKKQKIKEPLVEDSAVIFAEIENSLNEVLSQIAAKKIPEADLGFGETHPLSLSRVYDLIQSDPKLESSHSLTKKLNKLKVQYQLSDLTKMKAILSEWRDNKETIKFFKEHSGLKDDEPFAIDESRPWETTPLGDLIDDNPNKTNSLFTMADQAVVVTEKRKANPSEEYQKLIVAKRKEKEDEIKIAEQRLKENPLPPVEQLEAELLSLKSNSNPDLGEIEKKEAQIRLAGRPALLRKDLADLQNQDILTSPILSKDMQTAGKALNEAVNVLNKMFVSYCDSNFLTTYYGSIDLGMSVEHARWNQEAQKIFSQAGLEEFIQKRTEISFLIEQCRNNSDYLPQLFEKLKEFKDKYPPTLSDSQRDILKNGKEKLGKPLPELIDKRDENGFILHANSALAKEWNEKWGSKK